jgi:hypothetical protein
MPDELFRYFYAMPVPRMGMGGIGAICGVLRSVLSMIPRGTAHIGVLETACNYLRTSTA